MKSSVVYDFGENVENLFNDNWNRICLPIGEMSSVGSCKKSKWKTIGEPEPDDKNAKIQDYIHGREEWILDRGI